MKKFVSMLLALAMCLTLSAPAFAVENEPEATSKEYTYAYLVPTDAENVQYAGNGLILFKEGNEFKFLDCSTGEICVFAREKRMFSRSASVNHTPTNLEPAWIWFNTDGPWETNIDWNTLNKMLRKFDVALDIAIALAAISKELAVPTGVAYFLYESYKNDIVVESYWRIDDVYHYYDDYTRFHIESYWFSDEACTNQIGYNQDEWHG